MNTRDLYVRAIGDLVEQLDTVTGAVAVATAWLHNPSEVRRSNRQTLQNAVAISMRRITGAYMACQPDGKVAIEVIDRNKIIQDITNYSRIKKEIFHDHVLVHIGPVPPAPSWWTPPDGVKRLGE